MVKRRRLPAVHRVAGIAVERTAAGRKLAAVWILVASLALCGLAGKQERFCRRRRPVAIDAGHGAVRARERKSGSRMVKRRCLVPAAGVVAAVARQAQRLFGAWRKRAGMRIFMTSLTRQLPDHQINTGLSRRASLFAHMALAARHIPMPAGQRKARLLVARQGKARRLKGINSMALFAAIPIGSKKLARMCVLMAARARIKREFIARRRPGRLVAISAF